MVTTETRKKFAELSAVLAELLEEDADLAPHEAAELAAEKRALADAMAQTKKRLDDLDKILKRHIERSGDGIWLEGVGTLTYEDRPFGYRWGVKALHDERPEDFARLLEHDALTVDNKIVEALVHAGHFGGEAMRPPYRMQNARRELRWQK